jgi:hypothetical protein
VQLFSVLKSSLEVELWMQVSVSILVEASFLSVELRQELVKALE